MRKYLLIALILLYPSKSFALRPFVTTDADVAEPFEIEMEWGLFGFT